MCECPCVYLCVHFSIYVSVIPYVCVSGAMGQVKGTKERSHSHLLIMTIPLPSVMWPATLNFFPPSSILLKASCLLKIMDRQFTRQDKP